MHELSQAAGTALQGGFVTPMAMTALLLFGALALAETAVRLLHMPRIAALVLSGALVGWARARSPAAALMPVPGALLEALAMVLLFEVGQRVPLSWIRGNPWLAVASVGETAATLAFVFGVLALGFGRPPLESLFVGAICMAASPIVVLSVTKDLGARGQVSERALLFSTLSTVYAALALPLLATVTLAAAHVQWRAALQPLLQLAGSFLLGALGAAALRLYARLTAARGAVLTIGILCCCVLLYAVAAPLQMSPVLAALFFGLVVRATDRSHGLLTHQTSETGTVLTLGYFILLGASLPWAFSANAVAMAGAVFAARVLAKVGMNALLAAPSSLLPAKGAAVGLAMAPLSSLGLLFAAGVARHPGLEEAAGIGAAVVLVSAILGPLGTELALRYAQEPTRRPA